MCLNYKIETVKKYFCVLLVHAPGALVVRLLFQRKKVRIALEEDDGNGSVLTQHSRNCLASMGEVKFRPHVSLVMGSFQYTKHSEAWPIRVPKIETNNMIINIIIVNMFLQTWLN